MQESLSSNFDYLAFAPGVRLHFCQVRKQYWLLFPEAALALNPTAAAILCQCDGNRSLDEIVAVLQNQFCDVKINDVQKFLLSIIQRGLLMRLEVRG